MLHTCIFHSSWLVLTLACLFFEFCVLLYCLSHSHSARLFLSCTHIFACDFFFQFSLALLLPSLLTFFFPFSPLSPGPLLSPSERLRIPKGADAIKMLILSVYRERERGADSMRDCGSHGELD